MTPAKRLLYCTLLLAVLGVLVSVWPQWGYVWWGTVLALLLAALADVWLSRGAAPLEIERNIGGVLPVGVWHSIELVLHNRANTALHLQVIDDYPTDWQMQDMPQHCTVPVGGYLKLAYRVCPLERGDALLGAAYVRVRSPLGLWQRLHRVGAPTAVKVFPDFSKLLGLHLNAADRRVPTAGIIRKRQRGEGTDFRQLREYRSGDSQRSIDWKASARQQKLISREYQEERDQQVVFLLDTGRRMLAKDGDTSHFDHALNAVLTLGMVAQKQGDAVGLQTFGAVERWLLPRKGRTGLDRLLAGVYDLQADEVAPDYLHAAGILLQKLRKRAFVVLITNLRDEDDSAMRSACELLSERHLVMCASLREKALDAALLEPSTQFSQALRFCATAHYLAQRQHTIRAMGIRASRLLDTTPERLSIELCNRYMAIKEGGLL